MSATEQKPKWWQPLVKAIVAEVSEVIKEQNKRIDALESRMAQFGYKGVWQPGLVYRESNFVTDDGSIWACIKEQTTQRPGSGPDWRLAVKRGKDGRDARP